MRHTRGYIHKFDTKAQFDTARANDYVEPWLSYTESEAKVDYNKGLLETPLTFEITGDGDIVWKAYSSALTKTIEYKKNDGEWTSITSDTGSLAPSISVVAGDTIQFRGNNAQYATSTTRYNAFSGSTAQFKVKGNIMSLLNSADFSGLTTLSSTYTFNGLFRNCIGLTDASKLILPATTLAQSCYSSMFRGCTSLTTAPALPVTTLAQSCYDAMFDGCTSLTTAPELPATTLAQSCYSSMFRGCTSLTTAPALPATILASSCYNGMFNGCTSLTTAPALPVTTLAPSCYNGMFGGCTSLTTAPALPATTLVERCYYAMFMGCTSLTTAPELPATTLVYACCQYMFRNCSNLNYIKCLATDISANLCTNWWVNGVASTGTFVKAASMTGWTTDANGIPSGWSVQDAA